MNRLVAENVTPAIQPALDLVMPAQMQIGATWVASLSVVYAAYWLVRESRATGSRVPLYFWMGCVGMMFAEPIWDVAQSCIYPHVGLNEAFELLGRLIPLYAAVVYLSLGVFILMFAKRLRRGFDARFVWKASFGSLIGLSLFEMIPIHLGLWSYYGVHPWKPFGYPMGIGFINTAAFLATALFTAKVWPSLEQGREFLAMFICPIVYVGASFGVGWPLYSVATTSAALEGPVLPYAGLLATLMLSLATIWSISEFMVEPEATREAAAEESFGSTAI